MSFSGFTSAKYDNNATTLNGLPANRYMVYLMANAEEMLDPTYLYCYVSNAGYTFATEKLGLPGGSNPWYQILYICHQNTNGYGMQLAFRFAGGSNDGTGTTIYQRTSSGTTWTDWYEHVGTKVTN